MFNKLIAGAPSRKTRFHDASGRSVPVGRALRNGSRALVGAIGRVMLDVRPARPWISFDAQALIDERLDAESSVLEFGSGMSTLWFARRVGRIVSREDHAGWHGEIAGRLADSNAEIDYRHAPGREEYLAVPDGETFDIVLVDGKFRDECVELGLSLLKPGGMLYLDNADHGVGEFDGDVPRAVSLIEEASRTRGWPMTSFTDFAPTTFFAQRGLLIQRY